MGMISFAQNAEDVRLSRAFPKAPGGFYIDVGACHPEAHSVTKHFYDRGWRGVNVEPGREAFELLRRVRTRDVNLNLGVSDREGLLTFYEAPSSLGRSTFSADWTEGWTKHDGCTFEPRSVPVLTLGRICELYADGPIDFLKIDAEGHERQVIAGGDWHRWRPRVVVVEAAGFESWERPLIEADYLFAAFDGINRFYARAEDRDLVEPLAAPVSALDDYVTLEAHLAAAELRDLRARCAEQERAIAELAGRLASYADLGPQVLGLARGVKRLSARFPRVASAVRSAARRAG